jgi:hypothetical protein
MLPPGYREWKRVSSNELSLSNLGTQTIRFVYLLGTDWKSEQIDPGQSKSVSCDACNGLIKVAFNDGSNDQSIEAALGYAYIFYWNAKEKRWDLSRDFVEPLKSRGVSG